MALFIAEVQGANSSANRTYVNGYELIALTFGRVTWEPLRLNNEDPDQPNRAALFESRELARAAVLSCLWNGQRFRVRGARGHARAHGIKVG